MVKRKMPVSYKNQAKYQVQNPTFHNPAKLFDIFRNFLIFNPYNSRNENATDRPAPIQNCKFTAFATP